jgi:hypothetical protein
LFLSKTYKGQKRPEGLKNKNKNNKNSSLPDS